MERELTIAEATRTFADIVARVQDQGESTSVVENGRVIARIVPATKSPRFRTGAESLRLWNDPSRPRLTPEEVDAFEADLRQAHEMLLPPKEDPWE